MRQELLWDGRDDDGKSAGGTAETHDRAAGGILGPLDARSGCLLLAREHLCARQEALDLAGKAGYE